MAAPTARLDTDGTDAPGPGGDAGRPLGLPPSLRGGAESGEGASSTAMPDLGAVLQTLGPLAFVLALVAGFAWLTRRVARHAGVAGRLGAGGRAPSGVVEVLARYPVGRGQVLALIKIGPRVLVTCQSHGRGGGMRTLSEITDAEEVALLVMKTAEQAGEGAGPAFRAAMRREDLRVAEMIEHKTPRRVRVAPSGDRVELLTVDAGAAAAEAATPAAAEAPDPFDALRGRLEDWRRRAAR